MYRIYLCFAAIFVASYAVADVPMAEKYVTEAKLKLAGTPSDYDRADARKKLDLAELELADVAADSKKPVAESIASLRKQIEAQELSNNIKTWKRDLKSLLDDAEGAAGNLATWPGLLGRFETFARKPGVAHGLGDELTEAKKKIESLGKLYTKNKTAETAGLIQQGIDRLENRWAEKKDDATAIDRPEARTQAVEEMEREIAQLSKTLKELSPDHETRKTVEPRLKKIAAEIGSASQTGAAGEVAGRLTRSWELDMRETMGWEAEKADVTFERYTKEQSATISAFGAPKTVELLRVSTQWLKNHESDAAYQAVKDVAAVKKIVGEARDSKGKAQSRLESSATNLVSEAEKTPVTTGNLNSFERLISDIRSNLCESEKSAGLQQRVRTLIDKQAETVAKGEQANREWYKASTEQAEKKWPELKAAFKAGSGFDPTQAAGAKGKLFSVKTDNLMGYRFKPGDFPFATTMNGHAVAAKYDPVIARGIEVIQKKLGRDLGDNDDDGKWDIVFRIDGTTGRLMARKNVEGDLLLEGEKVGTYRGEYSEPTDAVIVTIVAAKCGPLAVSADAGLVTETGDLQKVSGKDTLGWTGYGFFGSLLRLIIGIPVAILCVVHSGRNKFIPLPSLELTITKYQQLLAAFGAAAALFGLYWLVMNSFRGFIGALVFMIAGSYVTIIILNKMGMAKHELIEKTRPYGLIAGGGCAFATICSLFSQGRIWLF